MTRTHPGPRPKVLVCTVATSRQPGLVSLERSCHKFGLDLTIFGTQMSWRGLGWRQRVLYWNLWRRCLAYDYVLFVDGYDCIVASPLEEIMQKYFTMKTPLLFGAEVLSHPLPAERYPASGVTHRYNYLNAGGFIGEMGYVLRLMTRLGIFRLPNDYYDQQRYAEAFVSGRTRITLDHDGEIFQCLFFASDDLEVRGERLANRRTSSTPCIIHGNGGTDLAWVRQFVLGV